MDDELVIMSSSSPLWSLSVYLVGLMVYIQAPGFYLATMRVLRLPSGIHCQVDAATDTVANPGHDEDPSAVAHFICVYVIYDCALRRR